MMQNKKKGVLALLIAFTLGTVWFLRGTGIVHFIGYGLYEYIEVTFTMVMLALLSVAFIFYINSGEQSTKNMDGYIIIFVILLVVSVPIIGFMGSIATKVTFANEHMNFEEADEMKQTASNDVRLLPRKVGDTYAQNRLQFERHDLSTGDITINEDGSMAWTYNIKPEGFANKLAIHQAGAVTVDMTSTSAEVNTIEQEVVPGVGDFAGDNVYWQLRKSNFWLDYKKGESYVVNRNDNLYLAVPYVEHQVEFKFPYPFPFTTPHEGGVALVNGDTGEIEHVDIEDIKQHEILKDQRAVSYDITKYYVNSMKYKNGIINAWFFKEGVPEVANAPGDSNQQPYLIRTEDGELNLMIAAEPAGDASAIYQTYYQNAQTGEWVRYQSDRQDTMVGPVKSTEYVQAQAPTVDWNEFTPVEPLPIIRDDGLFWMTRVIPDSGGGVSYVAFVNAQTNEVIPVADDETARKFIAGEISTGDTIDDIGTEPVESSNEPSSSVSITIIENGEEREIEIKNGTKIVIENKNN